MAYSHDRNWRIDEPATSTMEDMLCKLHDYCEGWRRVELDVRTYSHVKHAKFDAELGYFPCASQVIIGVWIDSTLALRLMGDAVVLGHWHVNETHFIHHDLIPDYVLAHLREKNVLTRP